LGGVHQIDRDTGAKSQKMLGLDYGAGLAFDGGDLIVQDLNSSSLRGRLQRVPVAPGSSGLEFGDADVLLAGMSSAYGVATDADGNVFTTGKGGVYNVAGTPAAETLFYNNGRGADQFSTALAFFAGATDFAPYAGTDGGVLAVAADADAGHEDMFITLFTPALPQDFNADGNVDGEDRSIWAANFGNLAALRGEGDADGDHDVDGADFLSWQLASGSSTLLPGIAAAAAALGVPEPARGETFFLIALIFLGKSARSGNVKSVGGM
jgi:hypothetical protein